HARRATVSDEPTDRAGERGICVRRRNAPLSRPAAEADLEAATHRRTETPQWSVVTLEPTARTAHAPGPCRLTGSHQVWGRLRLFEYWASPTSDHKEGRCRPQLARKHVLS